MQNELQKVFPKVPVIMEDMPDPHVARETIWIPFIMEKLGCNENTLIIGHSSGAVAIMRLLEKQKVKGAVIVSGYHSDLGDSNERASGYFSRPWNWQQMRSNAERIVQVGSEDDQLVPYEEMEYVQKHLECELINIPEKGHFMIRHFPELVEIIKERFSV